MARLKTQTSKVPEEQVLASQKKKLLQVEIEPKKGEHSNDGEMPPACNSVQMTVQTVPEVLVQNDSETEEPGEVFHQRIRDLTSMINDLYSMGLPRINAPISQTLLTQLQENPTDKQLILRAISIMLEGCSANVHLTRLSEQCLTYLQQLVGHRPIQIETMCTVIYKKLTANITTLRKQKVTKRFDKSILKKMHLTSDFISEIDFVSTDCNGYQELLEIDLLSDYGDVNLFLECRQLRRTIEGLITGYELTIKLFNDNSQEKFEEAIEQLLLIQQTQKPLQVFEKRIRDLTSMINDLYSMGLPRINAPISQTLLTQLQENPTDKQLILRAISIMLEGCSANVHLTRLSEQCLTYLQQLVGHRPIQIETMCTVIYKKLTANITTLRKQKVTKRFDKSILKKMDLTSDFISEIEFVSTDCNGYQELLDIDLLSDYGDVNIFLECRQLRRTIEGLITGYELAIKLFNDNSQEKFEEALEQLLLMQQKQIPLTQKLNIPPSSDQLKQFDVQPLSNLSSSKISSEIDPSEKLSQSKRRTPDRSDQILKNKKKQSFFKINQSEPNDKVQESEQKQQLKKAKTTNKTLDQMLMKQQKQKQNKKSMQNKQVDEKKVIQLDSIFFYNDANLEVQLSDLHDPHPLIVKRMQNRVVQISLHDGPKYHGPFKKSVPKLFRNPFHKYSNIDYDQDSQDDMQYLAAESINSELRSDDSSESSLADFLSNNDFNEQDFRAEKQELFPEIILDRAILEKEFSAILLLPDLKVKLCSKKANDPQKLKDFIAQKKGLPDINPQFRNRSILYKFQISKAFRSQN